MLATHVFLNGQCKKAIELYKKALNATVKTLIADPDSQSVVHAEIMIHDGLLMLSDLGNKDAYLKAYGYQLCVRFDNEADLKKAYWAMQEGSILLEKMQATDYSPCVVRFMDKFGVIWGFWI